MEHSILEKEHVPSFIQQISEVIDVVRDKPQAALATAAAAATEGQSVQPPSDAKSEDELDCGNVGMASSINFSPPCSSSPSHSQKETKTEGSSEVE